MSEKICPSCGLQMADWVAESRGSHNPYDCIRFLKIELEKARQVTVRDVYAYEAGLDEGRRECKRDLERVLACYAKKIGAY